jgi:hypothetical protein
MVVVTTLPFGRPLTLDDLDRMPDIDVQPSALVADLRPR